MSRSYVAFLTATTARSRALSFSSSSSSLSSSSSASQISFSSPSPSSDIFYAEYNDDLLACPDGSEYNGMMRIDFEVEVSTEWGEVRLSFLLPSHFLPYSSAPRSTEPSSSFPSG